METGCSPAGRMTRALLGYGVLAGPFYVTVSLAQALTRDGFRLDTHSWSLLENGDLGWIQIANLIVTGLMTVAAAAGLRRAMTPSRAVPLLIAAYGAGMIGGGIFTADPARGFPAGTAEATPVSGHGLLHLVTGGIGFLCLVAATLLTGAHLARRGQPGLARFSRITGVVFLAAFAGIASGAAALTLPFAAAIVLVWAWLATVCAHFYRATV